MGYPFRTAKDILENDSGQFIRTFIDSLDRTPREKFFGLGGSVIEICGASGTGKTAFCMQLSTNICLPKLQGGEEGHVVYIETDKRFSYNRLLDIYAASTVKLKEKWSLTKMIHFYEARTPAELMGVVIYLKTLLKAQLKGTKLIIIDSFSSIFRSMFAEYAKMIQLQAEFFLELNKLVRKFNIMVVITSQITDKSLASESFCDHVHRRLLLKKIQDSTFIGLVDKFPSQHVRSFKYEILKDGLREC